MTNIRSKPLTGRKITPPPGRVLWFESLFYVSTFLSAIGVLLQWVDGLHYAVAAAMLALLVVQLVLIWFTARRRKDWARKLLLAFFLVWAIGGIINTGWSSRSPDWQSPDFSIQALKLTKILLETTGLILVFTGSAHWWFHPRIGGRDPNSPW